MKKAGVLIGIVLAVCFFSSCSQQELVRMSTEVHDDYAAIAWEGRTYVPYSAIAKTDCGKQIGIVDDDTNDRVYEYKDYPVEEWIVNIYHSGLMDSAMLLRETGVTDIPEGLRSEYEWNNE